MAKGNFLSCLPVILGYEGGLSMVRSDPGNWSGGHVGEGVLKGTNMGIAASAHPTLDIARLTRDQAAEIYQNEYWQPAGCEALAAGLDLCHFDGTVNSGTGNSRKWLAIATTDANAIQAYSDARLHSLESFKTWATFGKGWAARVAGVEAKALAMSGAAKATIAAAGAAAADKAKVASSAAHAGAIVTGAAATAAVATPHPVLGMLIGLASLVATVWSAFHASTSGARAAVFAHASAAS